MFYPSTCVGLRYGCRTDLRSGFSRQYGYRHYRGLPGKAPYYGGRIGGRTSLPPSAATPFNGVYRYPAAVSLLRRRVAPCGSNGMLTVSAIAIAIRLRLRTRLTPG